MYICSACGKETIRLYPGDTCQGCYNYFHKGGTVNPLPDRGELRRDARGYIICHICGRAYKRLGSHVRESHALTIAEYKDLFSLCHNAKTTERNYSRHMQSLAYTYQMPQRLIRAGQATRIKPGEKHMRLGKKSSLQECLQRSARYKLRTEEFTE